MATEKWANNNNYITQMSWEFFHVADEMMQELIKTIVLHSLHCHFHFLTYFRQLCLNWRVLWLNCRSLLMILRHHCCIELMPLRLQSIVNAWRCRNVHLKNPRPNANFPNAKYGKMLKTSTSIESISNNRLCSLTRQHQNANKTLLLFWKPEIQLKYAKIKPILCLFFTTSVHTYSTILAKCLNESKTNKAKNEL